MKRGFSLIELLAVLVLLALMAIIIIPKINDNLLDAETLNAKNNTINYISALETYLKTSALDKDKVELPSNNEYKISEENSIGGIPYPALNSLVEITGDYPDGGTVTIDDNYTVVRASIVINGYNVEYNSEDKIVSINPA